MRKQSLPEEYECTQASHLHLTVRWVCTFVSQPNFRLLFVFVHGPLELLWLCKMVVKWYVPCDIDWLPWVRAPA